MHTHDEMKLSIQRKWVLVLTVFALLLFLPIMPGKMTLLPIAFAYQVVYWSIVEQEVATFLVHAVLVIVAHITLSAAISLAILRRQGRLIRK